MSGTKRPVSGSFKNETREPFKVDRNTFVFEYRDDMYYKMTSVNAEGKSLESKYTSNGEQLTVDIWNHASPSTLRPVDKVQLDAGGASTANPRSNTTRAEVAAGRKKGPLWHFAGWAR